jgi:hypothetical protein
MHPRRPGFDVTNNDSDFLAKRHSATDIAISNSLADLAARIRIEREAPSGLCSGEPPSRSKFHIG